MSLSGSNIKQDFYVREPAPGERLTKTLGIVSSVLFILGAYLPFVKIELPKNWDNLMTARGYAPLSTFTLTSDLQPDTPKPRVRPYATPGIRGDRPQRGTRPFRRDGTREGSRRRSS